MPSVYAIDHGRRAALIVCGSAMLATDVSLDGAARIPAALGEVVLCVGTCYLHCTPILRRLNTVNALSGRCDFQVNGPDVGGAKRGTHEQQWAKRPSKQHFNLWRTTQRWCFMISCEALLVEIGEELDNLLAAAPGNLSAGDLQAIKEEAIGDTRRVLDALTTQELQSPLAYNRFLQNTLAQARMRMHERRR